MSDPRLDQTLNIGGNSYVLRYTHTALGTAEKLMGMKVPDIAMLIGSGRFGFGDVACLVTAGLEGARRKLRLSADPWTLERVEELLDDADDFDTMVEPVVKAFDAALQKWFPDLYGEADEALSGGDEQDPPTAAGVGTDNSEPQSVPDSEPTTSGV